MDGSDVKRLFVKPIVSWPNGITIDHIAERIYWVDAKEDYIASSDLDGHKFRKVIMNNVSQLSKDNNTLQVLINEYYFFFLNEIGVLFL
jgi:hypothetical protein